MAKTWKTVREEAVQTGLLDEAAVAVHRERLTSEVRAHKLAEVRRAQRLTQVEVAEAMNVTQSRVSRLEKGELDTSEVGTLRKYVEALGGHLRLVADFGDEHVTVG
jgi:predicted XRE-type DNA-binding protein